MNTLKFASNVICLLVVGSATAADAPGARLPEGDRGIAAKYRSDKDIQNDADVIFVEKFDRGSVGAIAERWESVKAKETMSLSGDTPDGSGDEHSLLITHTGGSGTGGALYRRLQPGYAAVFARFYV